MRPSMRTAVPILAVLAAVCISLAACGNGSSAPRARRAATVAASPQPVVTVMRLYPSGFGLVGTATRPGGDGVAQLLETTNFGATFHLVSPPTAHYTVVDDAWAANRSLIWFDAYNTATTRERLYRTRDGGRSWASTAVPGHSQAGGSDSLDFTA